jgi:hypothetical protein
MSENLIALQNKFLGRGTTVYDKLSVIHEQKGFIDDEDILALAEQYNLPPPTSAPPRSSTRSSATTGRQTTW